jgi:hypothetical protein
MTLNIRHELIKARDAHLERTLNLEECAVTARSLLDHMNSAIARMTDETEAILQTLIDADVVRLNDSPF